MSPAVANFLFETANLLLLAAVLGRILFKPVRRALDQEQDRHTKEEQESKRLRAEAESLVREARAAREAADHESIEQRRRILEAAQNEAARILEAANKAQAAERCVLEQELTASREAQAAALAETVGRIASESVARLLDALHGPSLDVALFRAACEQIRAFPSASKGPALVESARPLDTKTRKLLEAVLTDGFQERTVHELGAGVRVTTSAGQVDATAVALARRAARAVSAAGTARAETVEGRNG